MGSALFLQALSLEKAMIGDSETMRLLVDAGDEFGDMGVAGEWDRLITVVIWDDDADIGIPGMVARLVATYYFDIGGV